MGNFPVSQNVPERLDETQEAEIVSFKERWLGAVVGMTEH